jgi:hypothetical protein
VALFKETRVAEKVVTGQYFKLVTATSFSGELVDGQCGVNMNTYHLKSMMMHACNPNTQTGG